MKTNVTIYIEGVEDEANGSIDLCLSVETAVALRDELDTILATKVADTNK